MDIAKKLNKDINLQYLNFYQNPIGWYIDSTEDGKFIFEEDDEKDWSFIGITKKEIENLKNPESKLDMSDLRVYPECITYSTNGKHTNEEFWSAGFNLRNVLNQLLCK